MVIFIMWSVAILPSCFDPSFCYFDDPTTLLMSKLLAKKFQFPRAGMDIGRFVPCHFFHNLAAYEIFGRDLYGHYLIQGLMFLFTLLMVYYITKRSTGSAAAGLLSAFLVVTASPVMENMYTFGKPDPKVLFYLVLATYLFVHTARSRPVQNKPAVWLCRLAIAGALAIAMLTKEPALVFFIFGLAGLLAFRLPGVQAGETGMPGRNNYALFAALAGLLAALARGAYYALKPANSTDMYVSYAVTPSLVTSNLKFYIFQQPDVIVLFLLGGLVILLLYKKRDVLKAGSFAFISASFMIGAAFLCVQLVWRWPLGYYLLIPAAFLTLAVVIGAYTLRNMSGGRATAGVVILLAVLLRLYTIPYSCFIANAQRAQDRVYNEAVDKYMELGRPGERLLVEQWQFYGEPVIETNLLIREIFGDKDFQVYGISDIAEDALISPEDLKLYDVKSAPDRAARLPRDNDFILVFTANVPSKWILRGVSPYVHVTGSALKAKGFDLEKVAGREIKWRGIEIGLPSLIPRAYKYSTGYELYKVRHVAPL
jgi:hypothetical protein